MNHDNGIFIRQICNIRILCTSTGIFAESIGAVSIEKDHSRLELTIEGEVIDIIY